MTTTEAIAESAAAPAPGRRRQNRGSEVVRGALLDAAIQEFAAEGFNGASGRSMAVAAGAHQSQINYHFASKEELWKAAIGCLLDELDEQIDRSIADTDQADAHQVFAAVIRGLVQFAARRPELNRLMMHEGAAPGERLGWLVRARVQVRHGDLLRAWSTAVGRGGTAPVDADLLYHSLIGAASLLYANAPEAELLGIDPTDPDLVTRHADALVALFLPGTRNQEA